MDKCWSEMYLQRTAKIDNRNAWFYLISTSIGNFSIVEYEERGLEIKRRIFDGDYDRAERFYESVLAKMARGKL